MDEPRDLSDYRLLKPFEVQEMLGVGKTWVYRAANDGRLPAIRLGGPDGPLRFLERDVIAHIEAARAGWRVSDTSAAALRRPQSKPPK